MNILIIGGSSFIGPLVIDRLLSKGHDLTVFNRGRTKLDTQKYENRRKANWNLRRAVQCAT